MEWSQTFGGAEFDIAFLLLQSPDGGYALAGWTYSYGAGDSDFWLVKTDANGQEEWDLTLGRAKWDCAYSLIQTAAGGYALAGNTGYESYMDMWLIKISESEDTRYLQPHQM